MDPVEQRAGATAAVLTELHLQALLLLLVVAVVLVWFKEVQ
jgi:hypothetical protein